MVKTLIRHGNSLALVIDRPILDLLKIEPDTPLEITTDGEGLHVRPARGDDHKSRVRKATKRMMKTHEQTLRNLAK